MSEDGKVWLVQPQKFYLYEKSTENEIKRQIYFCATFFTNSCIFKIICNFHELLKDLSLTQLPDRHHSPYSALFVKSRGFVNTFFTKKFKTVSVSIAPRKRSLRQIVQCALSSSLENAILPNTHSSHRPGLQQNNKTLS